MAKEKVVGFDGQYGYYFYPEKAEKFKSFSRFKLFPGCLFKTKNGVWIRQEDTISSFILRFLKEKIYCGISYVDAFNWLLKNNYNLEEIMKYFTDKQLNTLIEEEKELD